MSEKTVEVKEASTGKTRLFRKLEDIVVMTPKEVIDNYEDVPTSIVIKPMTHSEAEVRKRLKAGLSNANKSANQKAGITDVDIVNYIDANDKLNSLEVSLGADEFYKEQIKFAKKFAPLLEKTANKDLSIVYDAEDKLRENAVHCVVNNCIKINFDDDSVEITPDTIDAIHPDLFYWILSKIEEESYLTDGEVLGFL